MTDNSSGGSQPYPKKVSVVEIEPQVLLAYAPICRRSELEQLHYDKKNIRYSFDGGRSWKLIPWRMSWRHHILRILFQADWPPPAQAFGWLEGRIAVAWTRTQEEEVNIAKCIARYDSRTERWDFQYLGMFESLADYDWNWAAHIGFEVFNHANSLHKYCGRDQV